MSARARRSGPHRVGEHGHFVHRVGEYGHIAHRVGATDICRDRAWS